MGIFGADDKRQSNDILIWVLLFFVIFGFGKFKNVLGNMTNQELSSLENSHISHRKRCKVKSCSSETENIGNIFGIDSFDKIFKNNWFFVVIVFGILFLFSDKGDEACTRTVSMDNTSDNIYNNINDEDINGDIDINNDYENHEF